MMVAIVTLLVALGEPGGAAVSVTAPTAKAGMEAKASPAAIGVHGPTRARGPKGARGPAGPADLRAPRGRGRSRACWRGGFGDLVVGRLDRHARRTRAQRAALKIATGDYQVIFNQDVTGCIYQATLGDPPPPCPSARSVSPSGRRYLPGYASSSRTAPEPPTRTRRSTWPSSADERCGACQRGRPRRPSEPPTGAR